jgi:protein-disulfide isomerase
MSKTFWAIVAILILGLVAFLFINDKNKSDSQLNFNGNVNSVQESDHYIGPKDAKVVVIEYGDYQCPSCKSWEPKVEEFRSTMDDQTAFVFRNFPITTAHKNAVAGARATEAAALQNKFWEMNSLVYNSQTDWSSADNPQDIFADYAKQLNLDVERFNKDYEGSQVSDKINFDRDLATKHSVEGTPTFFINGNKLESANPTAQDNPLSKAVQDIQ